MVIETTLALIAGISGSLIAIISSVFVNIRHSRCTNIKCCGIQCNRTVMTTDELMAEKQLGLAN